MIRRSTWVVLVILLALVGFSFYLKDAKSRQAAAATPTPGPSLLFSPSDGQPTDIRIEGGVGTAVEIARDQNGKWVLRAPAQVDADQAAAEAAATQVGALRVISDVQLGPDVVGLDKPAYTITIGFGQGKTHNLLVGSVTPIQTGYYVQLDGGPNQIVDRPGIDSLLGMLTRPPYLATPTAPASPTASASPTEAATATTSSTNLPPTTSPEAATATSTP
jgi:Domain of unknown function (DUF4340)